jgi:ribosomal protein S12 methylthiotransferase accessory factor
MTQSTASSGSTRTASTQIRISQDVSRLRIIASLRLPSPTHMTQTFIPSKDASLESSISTLHAKLLALGFHVVEKSWLNEIENIWSVHVTDRDCTRLFSNGKGGSELAARASALGEFFERLGTNYFWTHFYLGETIANGAFVHYPNEQWFPVKGKAWPKGILNAALQKFYNPDKAVRAEQLIDLNSGNAARGICAIPYTCLRDNSIAYFPVNLIGNIYVSNGMSAGNTMMEARTQALSEIFERDIKFRIIRDGTCLPDVPDTVINRFPRIAAGIKGLRAAGFGILVKDASLGGKYPVMCVTMLHPKDQGIFASFGAHPRFEVALERALTELLQGRALDSLGDFPAPGFDMDEISEAQNLEIHFVDSSGVVSWEFLRDTPDYDFVDWNFSNTTEEDYNWSVNTIHESGHDIYVADFTHLDVYSCRIFVPGMSEIYPVEELQWENNTVGNLVRPAILRLPELTQAECTELLGIFDELDLADNLPIWTLIGLCADAGTDWADVRVGELKALLGLAAGDTDAALDGCIWLRQFGQLNEARARVYRCLENMLQLDSYENYEANLLLMFGATTLNQAKALITRKEQFFGLPALGANMEGSKMHTQLLAAYAKVQRYKTA